MSQRNQSLTDKLFSRSDDADDLGDDPPWRVGMSMAATWSWGAAVAVCISVLHTLGIKAAIVWTVFNCLSIGLFGLYYRFIPNVPKWKNFLPMLAMWGFIGYFAMVMNLNTMLAVLGGNMDIPAVGFMSEQSALIATAAIGTAIVWFIGVKGLRGSVNTDVAQLALQFIGAIGILAIGVMVHGPADVQWTTSNFEQSWLITAAMGFIFGATASGMQWQRIETLDDKNDKFKASLYGSAIFAVFLLIVFPAGFFYHGGPFQSVFLIVAALAVASSTADSGSALLQYISQRVSLPASGGTLISIAALLTFKPFASMGLTGIWSFYAGVRWKVILVALIGTLLYNIMPIPDSFGTLARKTYFYLPDRVYGDVNEHGDKVTNADGTPVTRHPSDD